MEESIDELKKQILLNEMHIDNLIKQIGKNKNNKSLEAIKKYDKVINLYKQSEIEYENLNK